MTRASEIEREVEASRANLEETVEALKDKMSISEIAGEAARYLGADARPAGASQPNPPRAGGRWSGLVDIGARRSAPPLAGVVPQAQARPTGLRARIWLPRRRRV